MNGERPQVNGQHLLNGVTSTQHHQAAEAKISRIDNTRPHGKQPPNESAQPYTNGILPNGTSASRQNANLENGLQQAPLEVLQLIGRTSYLPVSTMIQRTAQNCWNQLSLLVDQLSHVPVPAQVQDPTRKFGQTTNNQTKANLDKKDRILNFANDQKADFVKLLVLLQWSKNGEDVNKTMNLNLWLMNQRWLYMQARDALAQLKQEAPGFQIPNPDLEGAADILSRGQTNSLAQVGYEVLKPLKLKQIRSTLRNLTRIVSVRLALHESLPLHMQQYHVHDGRATFDLQHEMEVDLSVLEDSPTSPFRVVDFRFTYSPSPRISELKRQEIEFIANSEIDRSGLQGCYDFFHNLALTTKIAEFYNQALDLSRNQWSGYLFPEIPRRDLVVEYWRGRDVKKSWIEISIHSGQNAQGQSHPFLAARWFREGIEAKELDLQIDPAVISFDSVLLQVLAQHTYHALDAAYQKLILSGVFARGGLSVELSGSMFEPQDCVLEVQMTANTRIALAIDPVTGSIIVSPASEKANRLQMELNRSRLKVEDLVTRLLNFRCALVEESILNAVKTSSWQRLDTFKPTTNDIKTLFHVPMVRANFFRLSTWSNRYLVAVTSNTIFDQIWILHRSIHDTNASLANFRVIQQQTIPLECRLSTFYFDAFADYASGVVVLHSNADRLQQTSVRYRLPHIPSFEENYHLPELSFEPQKSLPTHSPDKSPTVQVAYLPARVSTASASVLVKLRAQVESTALQHLANTDQSGDFEFAPRDGLVSFQVPVQVGEPAIDEIVQRVTWLNDVMVCVQIIQLHENSSLLSLTMTTMNLSLKLRENDETSMVVHFPSATEIARLEFIPAASNPHSYLASQLSQLLADPRRSFAANLSSVLSALHMIHPLVMALRNLQRLVEVESSGGSNGAPSIRLHVLARQPTMIALQFFMSSIPIVKNQQGTVAGHGRLLARFEILPSLKYNGQWLIRPAIEEINAYTRPSFAAQELKDRVKEEIFAKKAPCPDWIRLDTAAVFLRDRPRPLLDMLHAIVVDWAQKNPIKAGESVPVESPSSTKKQSQPVPSQVNGTSKNARNVSGQAAKPQPSQINANAQRTKSVGTNKIPAKSKEVITLD
jgi:mediator of RNA polymerase II transcription subunit 14